TFAVGLVTSYNDFVRQYGEDGGYLEYAVWGFFQNGGKRAFIAGVKGAGALAATKEINSLGGAPTPGSVTSANAAPWQLTSGQTLVVVIDGGAPQTFTFTGARATRPCGAPTLPPAASSTLL